MAFINENLYVQGARGNVGKQFVYRRHGNNTLITVMPTFKPNAVQSEEQEATRSQFASAIVYAQGAIRNTALKKEYKKKAPPGNNAYNMAIRDFLKAPVVKKINTAAYKGTPGSTIVVHAKDDFRVVSVKVSIYLTATGELLEEGNAIADPVHRVQWIYTAVKAHNDLNDIHITATATDLPGNTGVLEVTRL